MAETGWFQWALLSAFFAALTAIFAKLGVASARVRLSGPVRA